jgi:cation diffusion facilitator CzcD-associated flavoprotein CzcO
MAFKPAGVEKFDVVVLGAGISGIDAAYHLKASKGPDGKDRSFVVLERRSAHGGTWDLFRYPGIRSDSTMLVFGYRHRAWPSPKPLASGSDILSYLKGTIDDNGLAQHIRYGHHVIKASWSSADAVWLLECANGSKFVCRFLFSCMGYYNQDKGHEPKFEGSEEFMAAGGQIVHPQKWSNDIDYTGKQVVVVGSGATAVTLVPAMAKDAAHVTMLQRSPTYIMSLPNIDTYMQEAAKQGRSEQEAYEHARAFRVAEVEATIGRLMANTAVQTEETKQQYIALMRSYIPREIMPDSEFNKHLVPRYNPWEQRLCLCPDNDFYEALKSKRASMCTDEIEAFDAQGVLLKSGKHLPADLIVTATGLQLHNNPPMADMAVIIDGRSYVSNEHYIYKGCMLSEVPNFAFSIGYFTAAWTLKVDITCAFVCRVLNHLDTCGYEICCPCLPPGGIEVEESMKFSSNYILRSLDVQPKVGKEMPWAHMMWPTADSELLERAPLEDGHLNFIQHMQQEKRAALPPNPGAMHVAPTRSRL